MTKFVTIVRTSILAAAAILASAPAFAETVPSVAVSYADLDLSSPAGQHRLHTRLVGAAREVCQGQTVSGTLIQTARNTCIAQATSRADTQFALLISKSQPHVAVR